MQRRKTGKSKLCVMCREVRQVKLCVIFVLLEAWREEPVFHLHGKEAEVECNVIVDPNLADHEGIDVEEEDFLDRQLLGDKEVESDPPSSLARFVFLCLFVCARLHVHIPVCTRVLVLV